MKEKIYTIPVTEAFREDCECPLCVMEKKLEDEAIEYTIGPSMMEPDHRIITNEKGFCNRHFSKLYNIQKNRLALGLVIDTHMVEQNSELKKLFEKKKKSVESEIKISLVQNLSDKIKGKTSDTDKLIEAMIDKLSKLENTCTICEKIDNTMDRFIDVVFYLYIREADFKKLFSEKKGFCIKHFKLLLEGSMKYLNQRQRPEFINNLMQMQLSNLERVQEDVNWFVKKFDYRYQDAPWKNSHDAIPRGIEKIVGPI